MNIEVFKTDKDGTKYILTCEPSGGYTLSTAEFYTDYPDTGVEPKYTYVFDIFPQDHTYEITQQMLNEGKAGINIKTDFVYVKISEKKANDPSNEQSLLMCTFYPGDIIKQLMGCIDSIPADDSNQCSNINRFNNLYMRFKAVALSIRTGDYITAQKYFNKFFSNNTGKPRARGGCHCNA